MKIGDLLSARFREGDYAPHEPERGPMMEGPSLPGLSEPSTRPEPPGVALSTPKELPPPPNVTLSTPRALPEPPDVKLSSPTPLPPPPAVTLSAPGVRPDPPKVSLSAPSERPAPPEVHQSAPSELPAPPKVQQSAPAERPAPPDVSKSVPAELPEPPDVTKSAPAARPEPPKVALGAPSELPKPPEVSLSVPAVRPDPPKVATGSPAVLPDPPAVVASVPAELPPPPDVALSVPATLPAPPDVVPSVPAVLPDPPDVTLSVPAVLPDPPDVVQSVPAVLPDPPTPPQSVPAVLPPPPPVTLSVPAALPPPPAVVPSVPAARPPPPQVVLSQPRPLPALLADVPFPNNQITLPDPASESKAHGVAASAGYSDNGPYSPTEQPTPGFLIGDPVAEERVIENKLRNPAKLALLALQQTTLTAGNTFGNVWNPTQLVAPAAGREFLPIALDLIDGNTEGQQVQMGKLVADAMDRTPNENLVLDGRGHGLVTLPRESVVGRLAATFSSIKNTLANGTDLFAKRTPPDPLVGPSFVNGIIPSKVKGENAFGFTRFNKGQDPRTKTDDDTAYLPVSFTDLRPVGNQYRAVYFRPLNVQVGESYAPGWNAENFFGRVDPVATYQSTTRTISLSFLVAAFGPEDMVTIYQKKLWLESMVYPEYDGEMLYKSGPVCRLRVGDLISAVGPEGARGVPGVIQSLDFDYTDQPWELRKDWKLPQRFTVSLSFLALHDVPIGRGVEGKFGGVGKIGADGLYIPSVESSPTTGQDEPHVDANNFRALGKGNESNYTTFDTTDEDVGPTPPPPPGF